MSELVTREYLWQRFPAQFPPKNPKIAEPLYNAVYEGRYGSIRWQGSEKGPSFQLWINGNSEKLGTLTIKRLLLICAACMIGVPSVNFEDI